MMIATPSFFFSTLVRGMMVMLAATLFSRNCSFHIHGQIGLSRLLHPVDLFHHPGIASRKEVGKGAIQYFLRLNLHDPEAGRVAG